jgi:hypothetical protein
MAEIVGIGPWKAGLEHPPRGYEAYIESEDFTHDVRLIVDGDFEGPEQCFAYAEEIAKRLNTFEDGKLNAFEIVPAAERGAAPDQPITDVEEG